MIIYKGESCLCSVTGTGKLVLEGVEDLTRRNQKEIVYNKHDFSIFQMQQLFSHISDFKLVGTKTWSYFDQY